MGALRHQRPLISLEPRNRLTEDDVVFDLRGWTEVDDENNPNIRLELNGVPTPVLTSPSAEARDAPLDRPVCALVARVDCAALLAADVPEEPFLLTVAITTDGRSRTFEYEVTDGWLRAVFGRPVRRRRIPPEHLQARALPDAVGRYHQSGRESAGRISDILARAGRPLASHRRVLDLGCGPGRVSVAVRDLHPAVQLFGIDPDGEAIGWARANLPDVAEFRVNGPQAALPFADESFDLVYSVPAGAHRYVGPDTRMEDELRRILKPGGVLLRIGPDAASLARRDGAGDFELLHAGEAGADALLLRRRSSGPLRRLFNAFRPRAEV